MPLKKQKSNTLYTLKKLLFIGILLELIIFIFVYNTQQTIDLVFRYTARYTGRVSLFVFLFTFYFYTKSYSKPIKENYQVKSWIILFAVLHIIHFYFLAMSVYLNKIPLEIPKIIGGALAYFMIVTAPFIFYKIKPVFRLIYFYYVSVVMAMTYVARIKGDFQGAEPFWYHYFCLVLIILCTVVFGIIIRNKLKLK